MSKNRNQDIEALIAVARSSLTANQFCSLKLSKPIAGGAREISVDSQSYLASGAEKIMVRAIQLKGALHLSVLHRFATKDITKNLTPDAAWDALRNWLQMEFGNAHLLTQTQDVQLITSRKGTSQLLLKRVNAPESRNLALTSASEHNRAKAHLLALDAPFLLALGISQRSASGGMTLVPAMANKFKQINKFLELFHTSLEKTGLIGKANLRVLDFGAGKGYLSFALDHYLQSRPLANTHEVFAIELRAELVAAGNAICTELALRTQAAQQRPNLAQANPPTLQFIAGDVRTHTAKDLDVMVALHACDTATDYAIHFGIRNQASLILCSPCCHKQLRPQIKLPQVLAPLLQHGIHLGQEAEMLTDGLRALLLEAAGYQTQVFEFIATEHTAKNKMILATRRKTPWSDKHAREVTEQIAGLKSFYGIREHCLEDLLAKPA